MSNNRQRFPESAPRQNPSVHAIRWYAPDRLTEARAWYRLASALFFGGIPGLAIPTADGAQPIASLEVGDQANTFVVGDGQWLVHNSCRSTAIGHYPAYAQLAVRLGAHRFNIPTDVWDRMSDAERWEANQKVLDRLAQTVIGCSGRKEL